MNKNLSLHPSFVSVLVLMTGWLVPSLVKAEDATNAPPKPHWESVAAAQVALTRGNSHTFLGAISLDSVRKSASDEILLGGGAGYGDTTTTQNGAETKTETANYLKGYGQWNHLFTERLYAGVRLEGLRDNVADIRYRFTVSPLAGYYLIKQTNTFLSGEVGPSYVNQNLGGDHSSYAALRLGERFEHKFHSGAKVWENLEWLPQVDYFANWILNAEVGVAAPISKVLDLRLVANDTFNNRPASGRLQNDFKLLAGIGYKF